MNTSRKNIADTEEKLQKISANADEMLKVLQTLAKAEAKKSARQLNLIHLSLGKQSSVLRERAGQLQKLQRLLSTQNLRLSLSLN